MPQLRKADYAFARQLIGDVTARGQDPITQTLFRDILDVRTGGDLTCWQLDRLVDHALRWFKPWFKPEEHSS